MFYDKIALVVDDSPTVSSFITHILKDALGFGAVRRAQSGQAGLQVFKAERIDWVFCDFEMPGMNGLEFLSALRAMDRGKSIPFIMITSHTHKETVTKALSAGASDFLAKPFTPANLIEKVRRLHGSADRRMAQRIAVIRPNLCQIQFLSSATQYEAVLVDFSSSGCLFVTQPFRQGGTIHDTAQLGLKIEDHTLSIKGDLLRMEADIEEGANPRVRAAFKFADMDESSRKEVNAFIEAIRLFQG